ncbi:hypothetical protein PENTCL1PPCAC_29384 [Pristionchus entomophagus]|uniref:Disease resistance R13L4/SHOC-2-like LRR domain-containing protein n=1 Tax=Pristionchus entomophagus TaxID=358040 RepID=A0AAV5ULY0_9BILA|nr:hypothetical protein PENTCL1PPCAC_29384 [Pristionchus entomophagus]
MAYDRYNFSEDEEAYLEPEFRGKGSNDLHLCGKGLTEIPAVYLAQLYDPNCILRLDLSNNLFSSIKELSYFRNLVSIDLSCNPITEIPAQLEECKNLRSFVCKSTYIEEIPAFFKDLTKLHTMNLSGNRIKFFPEVLIQMPALKILYLGANELQYLPYSIGAMTGLELLYLGGNQLRDIPATIGELLSLNHLTLSGNRLETIPPTVAQLQNLELLAIHDNEIRTLPTGIVKLQNLQQLSLRNNPLVNNFVHNYAFEPPMLKELAGRVVRRHHDLDFVPRNVIPSDLLKYLTSASQCVNPKCKGVYFEACIEHVKFVDFCGKYRVPLLQFLCSQTCARRASRDSREDSSSSSSDDDDSLEVPPNAPAAPVHPSRQRLQRVLIGQ